MKKLRNRIFIRLMFVVVMILGISMFVNIKAQRNLYIDYAIESFMGYEQGQEILDMFGVGDSKDRLSYEETIDKIHEFNIRDKIDIFKWSTRNILVFTDEEPTKQNEIIDYSFQSPYQDNYIYLMTQELGYKPFSIESFPFDVRESLLTYLKTNMNKKDEYGLFDIYVDYCLENDELVYLKWGDNTFGTITGDVSKTYLNNYCINGNLYWYDHLRDKYTIINLDELFKVIKVKSSSTAIGYGGASIEKIMHNNNLYFISSVYIGGNIAEYYKVVNCKLVNVVQDFDLFILQKHFEQNILLYIVALILMVLCSYQISNMISKPIIAIEKAALKISNNEFDQDIKITSKDELGSLQNSISIMQNNLKSTIRKLNDEVEKVKELESLRKDFINQFTHEMKTPLGIINGYSELIEEAETDEEKQKYLDIINRETVRINDLVQAMLKLSRLESGKVELSKEQLDLEDIASEVIDEFEVLLMKKNIKVEVDVIDKCVYGDKQQLMTVIRNFISNAIKHTDTKIVVTIDKGVKVFNEGKPIGEDKLNGIWYTFVTHDKTGTGLGLAICRSILELHNYQYGVTNKENGVEFYFFE